MMVIPFDPTPRLIGLDAEPEATVVPFTFTVDVASVTTGVTDTLVVPLGTDDV